MRAHLRPGGVLIINVGYIPGSDQLEKVVSATARSVFPYLGRDPIGDSNSLVVASSEPLSPQRMFGTAISGRWSDMVSLAGTAQSRWTPALSGGSVYTDDKAPVEWLTDLSLAHYALDRH